MGFALVSMENRVAVMAESRSINTSVPVGSRFSFISQFVLLDGFLSIILTGFISDKACEQVLQASAKQLVKLEARESERFQLTYLFCPTLSGSTATLSRHFDHTPLVSEQFLLLQRRTCHPIKHTERSNCESRLFPILL